MNVRRADKISDLLVISPLVLLKLRKVKLLIYIQVSTLCFMHLMEAFYVLIEK